MVVCLCRLVNVHRYTYTSRVRSVTFCHVLVLVHFPEFFGFPAKRMINETGRCIRTIHKSCSSI